MDTHMNRESTEHNPAAKGVDAKRGMVNDGTVVGRPPIGQP
jgi:hypothetical protein